MRTFANNSFKFLYDKFIFMKDKTTKIIDKMIISAIIFICLSIYLPPQFKTLSILLLALILIIIFFSKVYILKPNPNKLILLPILFYSLHIIGLFYSENTKEALFDLEVKLPIIILPILFLFIPPKFLTKENFWKYTIAIIIGLILNILFCFTEGIIRSVSNSSPLISEITYTNLTGNLHPSYLSLFASVALILNYEIPLKDNFQIKETTSAIIKIILSSIITFFILMLNSKTGIIIMAISYIWIIHNMFYVQKKRIKSIIIFLLVLISFTTIYSLDTLSKRHNTAIENITTSQSSKPETSSITQRKFIYKNSIKLILEEPLFGQGIGDVRKSLNKLYEQSNVHFYSYLNAHNQFIQTTIALGLLGLMILLLIFIIPSIIIIKHKQYFLLTIYIIIGISFLFESMLDRNMGSYFFSLIYILSIIYIDNLKNKRYELKNKDELVFKTLS